MRISREDLDAYVAAIHEVGEGAATSVRNALQDAHGMGVTEQRERAIAAIMDEIGVSGDRSQALAAELFDEVCALEGIEGAEFEIYDDLIDYGMLESNVRYFARSLVEHDVGRFLDQCSQLADFYVRRCNYESMVRNCYGNGVRFARVPMGTETCDWCIMLASRGFVYYSQESAEHGMHLHCVTGDTRVSTAELLGAERRYYQGPIVHIVTEGNDELTITPNHPVLTTRGWVAAGEVDDGDYLVCANLDHRERAAVPDKHHVPPTIEDVFSSLSLLNPSGFHSMPVAAEDFHGDGISDSEVNVVWADGLLKHVLDVAAGEPSIHEGFTGAHSPIASCGGPLTHEGVMNLLIEGDDSTSSGIMRGTRLLDALLRSHSRGSNEASIAMATGSDASFSEPSRERGAGDSVALGKRVQALATLIACEEVRGHGDSHRGRSSDLCNFDADFLEVLAKDVGVAPEMSGYGANGLPSSIRTSRVVHKSVSVDSCHVYNLTTRNSWYYANNIITHNCDCIVVPGVNGQTEIDGYDPDSLYRQWRESGFMPPKSPGVRRIAQTPSAGRRSVRHTETGGLTAQQLEAYYARMNAKTDVYDLEDEYQNILSEMLSRDSTLRDIDYTRIGDHYAWLRARLLSRV